MRQGNIIQLSTCNYEGVWKYWYAIVLKIYAHRDDFWDCLVMWSDGSIDSRGLHDIEFVVVSEYS